MPKTLFGEVYEDDPKHLYAQAVAGLSQALIAQANFTGLTYRVDRYASRDDAIDRRDGTEILDDTALVVASVVFDTLQANGPGVTMITDKGTGYNLAFTVPASCFATSGYHYVVEVWADPTSGDDYLVGDWVLECKATARG
jgi:hypothetical protein